MQNYIFDKISEFNKLNNSELFLFTQNNKVGHLILKTNISEKKDDTLINNVKKLDFIHCLFSTGFKQGKKTDNCCFYDFTFSIKKEFFNNIIDSNKVFGQFLNFVYDNNIRNLSDFVNITFPMVENLSNYANSEKLTYSEKNNEIIPCLEIFQKKDYTNINIDMKFMEIIGILKNLNSANMFKNAELL